MLHESKEYRSFGGEIENLIKKIHQHCSVSHAGITILHFCGQ